MAGVNFGKNSTGFNDIYNYDLQTIKTNEHEIKLNYTSLTYSTELTGALNLTRLSTTKA